MAQRVRATSTPATNGRPRDPSRDQAITHATLELMGRHGFDFSIEQVAERAGVAKTTIYRRFPAKEELVVAALETLAVVVTPPDTGSVRTDLIELTRAQIATAEADSTTIMGLRLLVDLWQHPRLLAIFTERLLRPARTPLLTIVRRGIDRGELRGDIDPDVIVDSLVGGIVYRTLMSGDLAVASRDLELFLDAAIEGVGRKGGNGG